MYSAPCHTYYRVHYHGNYLLNLHFSLGSHGNVLLQLASTIIMGDVMYSVYMYIYSMYMYMYSTHVVLVMCVATYKAPPPNLLKQTAIPVSRGCPPATTA